ncbi:MAG: Na+/H+ antiporter NhaA [Myxococcota bacterium]|nr:Na+/H+ antiporter NhaA [Myxococcota bacterium]
MARPRGHFANLLQEFSVPLLAGVAVALVTANADPHFYHQILEWEPIGGWEVFGHPVTFHFLVNEVFMVFFFAIAAKEITEAALPGGLLNPISKAVSPLIATLGGVVGPVAVFFAFLAFSFETGIYSSELDDRGQLANGWGIPTATDIALAWLVARAVFGKGHPAVLFLLLLAVADDAIGLVIIAGWYGDPMQPPAPVWLLLSLLGMGVAFALRRAGVTHWQAYVALGGPLAWSGLVLAHLHPALALAVIVPFIPGPARDVGFFVDRDEVDELGEQRAERLHLEHSPLHLFEHQMKSFVDFGLFFFAFANAGVELADAGPMTWIILGSLVVGKTVGVALFGWLGMLAGFPLPGGMTRVDLCMAGFVAALGLTVALFVASAAYVDPGLQGQAKMGALLSGAVGLVAVPLARALGIRGGGSGRASKSDPD